MASIDEQEHKDRNLPVRDTGMQNQSCYSSRQVQARHLAELNRSRQRGTMRSTPSYPTKEQAIDIQKAAYQFYLNT